MLSYDEKLTEFAQKKSLRRLSRPLRGRADALCDACGSTLPRILYGLKDAATDRCYSVGQSCLQALIRMGAIQKGYLKQSTAVAYQQEMAARGIDLNESTFIEPLSSEAIPASSGRNGVKHFPAPVFIYLREGSANIRATVVLQHTCHQFPAFGSADEPTWEVGWQVTSGGGVLLEKTSRPRPNALYLCFQRAWAQAADQLNSDAEETPITQLDESRRSFTWTDFWSSLHRVGLQSEDVSRILNGATPKLWLQQNPSLGLSYLLSFIQVCKECLDSDITRGASEPLELRYGSGQMSSAVVRSG